MLVSYLLRRGLWDLTVAAILAAGMHGVEEQMNPGKRLDIDMYAHGHTVTDARKLPLNLLDAVREAGNHAVVHVACSSEEYGPVGEEELPIVEEQPLRPASPYALSKVVQDYHALFCHRAYGTKTIRTRAFNMIGPGQSPEFVVSDFARQIAEAEAGMREAVMRVGNLEARRDFSDVRDLVGVYWDLVRKGEPGEVYNVCSGRDHSIQEILDILVGLSKVSISVEVDPGRMRKADIPVLRGDNGKMCALVDYRPRYSLQETLGDVLEWWRGEVGGNH
jgi:GDP-4-dehydro-6-deoxy-D-mannose reductase